MPACYTVFYFVWSNSQRRSRGILILEVSRSRDDTPQISRYVPTYFNNIQTTLFLNKIIVIKPSVATELVTIQSVPNDYTFRLFFYLNFFRCFLIHIKHFSSLNITFTLKKLIFFGVWQELYWLLARLEAILFCHVQSKTNAILKPCVLCFSSSSK